MSEIGSSRHDPTTGCGWLDNNMTGEFSCWTGFASRTHKKNCRNRVYESESQWLDASLSECFRNTSKSTSETSTSHVLVDYVYHVFFLRPVLDANGHGTVRRLPAKNIEPLGR